MYYVIVNDELYHHGIKGQRWGVRRYQNSDGSLTSEGRRHYGFGERVTNTTRKIRDYMTVKDENGKRHLSEKGKKVVKGAAIGTASAAAVVGATILGKKLLDNYITKNALVKDISNSNAKIDKGKETVIDSLKTIAATNTLGERYDNWMGREKAAGNMKSARDFERKLWQVEADAANASRKMRDAEESIATEHLKTLGAAQNLKYYQNHPLKSDKAIVKKTMDYKKSMLTAEALNKFDNVTSGIESILDKIQKK